MHKKKDSKILILDPAGYTAEYSYNLAKSIKLSFPETFLAMPQNNLLEISESMKLNFISTFQDNGSRTLVQKLKMGISLILGLIKINRFIEQNSINIIINQIYPISFMGFLFNLLLNKKIIKVQILHNVIPSHGERNWLLSKGIKKFISTHHFYIVHSASSKLLASRKYNIDTKLIFDTVLPLYTISAVDKRSSKTVPKSSSSKNIITFLMIGAIKKYKGIELAITAAKNLISSNVKDFKLIIAGKPNYDIDLFQANFKDKSLSNHIQLIPKFLSDSEMDELLMKADCMLMPYLDSHGSGVLSLAINYKMPVIASDLEFFKEILDLHYAGEVFSRGSSDDLSKVMQQFIVNNEYRDALFERSRIRSANYQTWESYSASIMNFIETSTR